MKQKSKEKKIKCFNCNIELGKEEIKHNWNFGKIWFCGNACATDFAVKEVLKLKNGKNKG